MLLSSVENQDRLIDLDLLGTPILKLRENLLIDREELGQERDGLEGECRRGRGQCRHGSEEEE
ncbi:hypothetical protein FRC06_000162, partial [Ceratobasidium sp. 370]